MDPIDHKRLTQFARWCDYIGDLKKSEGAIGSISPAQIPPDALPTIDSITHKLRPVVNRAIKDFLGRLLTLEKDTDPLSSSARGMPREAKLDLIRELRAQRFTIARIAAVQFYNYDSNQAANLTRSDSGDIKLAVTLQASLCDVLLPADDKKPSKHQHLLRLAAGAVAKQIVEAASDGEIF